MKRGNIVIAIVTIALFSFTAAAQVSGQPPQGNNFDGPQNRGTMLARELGLSQEQQMHIRMINRRQRVLLHEAQIKLRDARAEADTAIYSDELIEAVVEEKIRNVAMAQAEIVKIRLMSEVGVRNVLSPQQLAKFITIRDNIKNQQKRRQNQRRKNAQQRRDARRPQNPDRPVQ